jgi:hypothetical protein
MHSNTYAVKHIFMARSAWAKQWCPSSKLRLPQSKSGVYPKNLTEGGFWGNRSVPRDSERGENLSSDPLRFVFVFFDCPAGEGIRLPLERSGDAVHRQPESKPGDSLRSRLPVWQRGKGYYRLILDVGGRGGNTLR